MVETAEDPARTEEPSTVGIPRKKKFEEPSKVETLIASAQQQVEGNEKPPTPTADDDAPHHDAAPASTPASVPPEENSSADVVSTSPSRPGRPGTLFGLPNGVNVPLNVDSSLLHGRMLETLNQLPVSLINDALIEFDDALQTKGNQIRSHGAYLFGVIKRYISVHERAGSGTSGAAPMGESLTKAVQERLDKLVQDGFCSQEEMNDKVKSKIRMLSEEDALFAIEELASVDRHQIRNFSSYFMGILNRYMRGEKTPGARFDRRSHNRDSSNDRQHGSRYRDDRRRGRDSYRDHRRNDRSSRYGDGSGSERYRRDRSRDRYDDDRRSDSHRKDDRYDPRAPPQQQYRLPPAPPPPPPPQQQQYTGIPTSTVPPTLPRQGMPTMSSFAPQPAPAPQQTMFLSQQTQPPMANPQMMPQQPQQSQQQSAPQPVPLYASQPQNTSNRPGAFVSNLVPQQGMSLTQSPMQQPQQQQQYARMPSQSTATFQQQPGMPSHPQTAMGQPPGMNSQPQATIGQQPGQPSSYAAPAGTSWQRAQVQSQQQNLTPADILGLAEKAAAALQSAGLPPPQTSAPLASQQVSVSSFSYSNSSPYAPPQQQVLQPPPLQQQQQPQQQSPPPPRPPARRVRTTATMNQLPVTVQYAIQNLQATGHVEGTLDEGILGMIKDLPEPQALQSLQKFSSLDKNTMRNKTAYLAGMLRRELEKISMR